MSTSSTTRECLRAIFTRGLIEVSSRIYQLDAPSDNSTSLQEKYFVCCYLATALATQQLVYYRRPGTGHCLQSSPAFRIKACFEKLYAGKTGVEAFPVRKMGPPTRSNYCRAMTHQSSATCAKSYFEIFPVSAKVLPHFVDSFIPSCAPHDEKAQCPKRS